MMKGCSRRSAATAAAVLALFGAALSIPQGVLAQAPSAAAGSGISDIDREAEALSAELAAGIRTAGRGGPLRIAVGDFENEGTLPPLGTLWARNLAAALAERSRGAFTVGAQSAEGADFLVQGEILDLGSTVRIYTRLIRTADGSLVMGLRRDFAVGPELSALLSVVGGSVRRDSFEADSREAPLAVSADGTWTERTIHAGDEDWFFFTLPSEGMVTMETDGELDTLLAAYAGRGGVALGDDDDSGNGGNARFVHYGRAGDSYLVKVSGFEDETGAYRFSARVESITDDSEPNNRLEQASPLSLGAAVNGLFNFSGDVDWYRFEAPSQGGYVVVRTTGGMDTELALYDSRGNLIAENDDADDAGNARISRYLPAGIHYVAVKEYEGASGIYGLEADALPSGTADDYEDDDDKSRAKPITSGSAQDRTFSHSDDEDWVRFTAPRSGRYVFTAAAKGGLDTYLELFDEAGELMDENDDDGGDLDAAITARLAPGNYYLRVTQLDDELDLSDAGYTLSVDTRP